MREDLIQSAVSFLADPKVQSAPLAKKVSFLESKGMTSEEINEAMSRANGTSSSSATATTAAAPGLAPQAAPGGQMVVQPPPVPQRPSYDWRDIFIAAVLAGGVGYGVWTLAKVRPRDTSQEGKGKESTHSHMIHSGSLVHGSRCLLRKNSRKTRKSSMPNSKQVSLAFFN